MSACVHEDLPEAGNGDCIGAWVVGLLPTHPRAQIPPRLGLDSLRLPVPSDGVFQKGDAHRFPLLLHSAHAHAPAPKYTRKSTVHAQLNSMTDPQASGAAPQGPSEASKPGPLDGVPPVPQPTLRALYSAMQSIEVCGVA